MSKPRVIVLMATFNGLDWLPEQLNNILNQVDVDVSVIISDDKSSDATCEFIKKMVGLDNRITFLSQAQKFGSAGQNFYRLITEADITKSDYVALSDQDDIWASDKLIRHVGLIRMHQAEGVSSNVMAFWQDGKEKLIFKSHPQKELDYLFESAGPGCTFLMTPWLVSKVREQLLDANSPAKNVALHDWLIYAICRSHGRRWVIDEQSSVRYRQHGNNVVGANIGLKAGWTRLLKIKQHWYRNEILKVSEVAQKISIDSKVDELVQLLRSTSLIARFNLLKFVPQARRKSMDRLVMAFAIIVGLL